MIVALIDNGSLEPAAHRNLRAVAAALSARTGLSVHAVSWKHSDRIEPSLLDGRPAWTLAPFVRTMTALGQRDFVFVPFFVSAQGAIGSSLRAELEELQRELAPTDSYFEFSFSDGLAARRAIPAIVAHRVRAVLAVSRFSAPPPVILVDHGGPSAASAALRDQLAAAVRVELGSEIGPLAAGSMEGAHPPLLADLLGEPPFASRDVIVAPLFLSPGRHAGPDGDLAQICRAAAARYASRPHLTDLVGTHPAAIEGLAAALHDALATLHAHPSA